MQKLYEGLCLTFATVRNRSQPCKTCIHERPFATVRDCDTVVLQIILIFNVIHTWRSNIQKKMRGERYAVPTI